MQTSRSGEHIVEHLDVLIVGAGLSGIGAGYWLQARCADRSYAIFESRADLGGTWDLFRYPGIRSDSDMFTLGYAFRPWTEAKAIADGPSILNYVRETATHYGIDQKIRLRHKVVGANWDSLARRWIVDYVRGEDGQKGQVSCQWLHMCSGYYRYEAGHCPQFPGQEAFEGRLVHPQLWPQDLDYSGKKVVVIGSGATAMTLVPEMARTAAHVTMLQRSPTYVVSRPGEDAFANRLREILPPMLAYGVIRWRNVLWQLYFYQMTRLFPQKVKERLLAMLSDELGPDYDVARHFTPRYNPWDQRLCLVPDSDLFVALKNQSASVVTDHIETFTPQGIKLQSGDVVEADIVVTATGLEMQMMGAVDLSIDGKPVNMAQTYTYKGMMYSGVPNLSSTFGYTNASWTLKADLTAEYLCRLLNRMKAKGLSVCVPENTDPDLKPVPYLDFSSGYVTRATPNLPKQGTKAPWKVHQNYALDVLAFRFGRLNDGVMVFA
jgi:monooxygenase